MSQTLKCTKIFGIDIKNYTYGNRNVSNKKINIKNIQEYFDILQKKRVCTRQSRPLGPSLVCNGFHTCGDFVVLNVLITDVKYV